MVKRTYDILVRMLSGDVPKDATNEMLFFTVFDEGKPVQF